MLHLQRGNRNKTVLDVHVKLWNKLNQTEIINLGTMCSFKIGTRNKTVPNGYENNVFYLQIGTRNKTMLIHQSGNNMFHLKFWTRNKIVLNDQFENSVFHSKIGIRDKQS